MKCGVAFSAALVGAVSVFAYAAEEPQQAQPVEGTETEESEEGFHANLNIDFLSDYVWRGQILCDAPVWQPGVELAYDFGDFGKLTTEIWSSLSLTDKKDVWSRRGMGFQEIDYRIAYSKKFGDFNFEVGHFWYTYCNTGSGDTTQELYGKVEWDNKILKPTYEVYWDYTDSGDNDPSAVYMNLKLDHKFAVDDQFSVTPYVSLGLADGAYLDYYGGVNKAEFADQNVGVTFEYEITDNVSLGAYLNYSWIVSHELRNSDYVGYGKNQILWGGFFVWFGF